MWKVTLETGLSPSGEERLSQKTNLIIKDRLRRRDAVLHLQTKVNCNSSSLVTQSFLNLKHDTC